MVTGTDILWVAGGGAVGAWCRFQITAWFTQGLGKAFPCGTLFVNAAGSFIMGCIVAAIKAGFIPAVPWHDFIAEGFLGALTTFSTFSMDSFKLFAEGKPGLAALNILLNMILCLLGVTAGVYIVL